MPSNPSVAGFATGRDQFPIRWQNNPNRDHNMDVAVRELRQPSGGDNSAQTQAWLAYALMTGAIDDWPRTDVGAWAEFSDPPMSDAALKARAQQIVEGAYTALNGTPLEYDGRWALAFVSVHNRQHARAVREYQQALDALDDAPNPPPRRIRRALCAEAVDACVYAGDMTAAGEFMREVDIDNPNQRQDWFLWVDAWLAIAQSVLATSEADRIAYLKRAVDHLQPLHLPAGTVPNDFDITLTFAIALWLRNGPGTDLVPPEADRVAAVRHRNNFQREVTRTHRKSGDWTHLREVARSPFHEGPPVSGEPLEAANSKKIRDAYLTAVSELFAR